MNGDNLRAMTVSELKEVLDDQGIAYRSSDRKADLIDKLKDGE